MGEAREAGGEEHWPGTRGALLPGLQLLANPELLIHRLPSSEAMAQPPNPPPLGKRPSTVCGNKQLCPKEETWGLTATCQLSRGP